MKPLVVLTLALLAFLLPAAPAQAQRSGWSRLEKIKDGLYEDLKDVRALNSRLGSSYYSRRIRGAESAYYRVREHINERSVPLRYAYDEAEQLRAVLDNLESDMRARMVRGRYPDYGTRTRYYEERPRYDVRSSTRTYYY